MRNSLAVISFALLPIAIILTFVSTSLVHYLPSTLDVYLQFNIKSVEASKAATTTTTNTTSAADAPQSATTRSYVNPVFGISVKYPSTWSAFDLNARFRDNATYAVALLRSPLENASDKYAERVNFAMQKMKLNNMTLDAYTSKILDGYRNATGIKIQDSAATTLGGQPAHRIVYTDDSVKDNKLKKIQVWTVVNNSKAYVITFGAEESKYNDYLSDVQNILSSFKITTGSSDNSSQEQRNHLTFYDPMFGVKLEYPSSWTKTQPGLPLDNRTLVFIVSFIAPRPAISIPDNENNSSSNSSAATINVGINDLARFISGKRNSPTSFNNNNTSNNTGNTGNRDLTLAEYSSRQVDLIKQLGAELRSSIKTTVAGLPGQQVYYVVDKGLLIIQAWTLNEGKAYHIVLSANDPDTFVANLPVFYEMIQSMQFNFNSNSIKTNTGSSD